MPFLSQERSNSLFLLKKPSCGSLYPRHPGIENEVNIRGRLNQGLVDVIRGATADRHKGNQGTQTHLGRASLAPFAGDWF